MTTESKTVKSFYSYTKDDMFDSLVDGFYHLVVSEAIVTVWESDGAPKLDINTKVKSGQFADSFGPRHTWTPLFEDKHGVSKAGREYTIEASKNNAKLAVNVMNIMDGLEVVLTDPEAFDENMLKEIARQIKGREFIAKVTINEEGYSRMSRIYSMSVPPKGVKLDGVAAGFSIDDI